MIRGRRWLAGACLFLQACSSVEKTVETAPEPAAPPVFEPPSSAAVRPPESAFCDQLERIITARYAEYRGLEGPAMDDRTVEARLVPNGFGRCEIQGTRAATARYVCRGQPMLHRTAAAGDIAPAPFNDMAGRISACLEDRRWPDGKWLANDVMVFGDDERLQTWHDLGKGVQQKLALKIERDFRNDLVYLRLEVAPR